MNKDNFVNKTCKLAKNVVSKTQKVFEISQLNLKIIQIKNKIERKYVKIGYCIYNKQREEGLDKIKYLAENEKFKLICKEIDKLYEKLHKTEEELEEIRRYDKNKKKITHCKCSNSDEKYEDEEYESSY